jgi:dynein heavy chain
MSKDRIEGIINFHTKAVYKNACRSLFERHKLLLSMQICIKIQMAEGKID